jgi:hypothetical protein
LSFQPLIFSQPAVFFSHNKSANGTFSRLFSAKRTGWPTREKKHKTETKSETKRIKRFSEVPYF